MAAEVVLPRQGWTMEVGSIVEWLKRDGDRVEVGEVLFTLQSDKAVAGIEALDAGVLRIPPDSPAPGVEVPIGTVLAYIVPVGERAPFEADAAGAAVRERAPSDADAGKTGTTAGAALVSDVVAATGRTVEPAPPVEVPAAGMREPQPPDPGQGVRGPKGPENSHGRATARGAAGAKPRGRVGTEHSPISPRARRVARELGIEWATLRGSGSSGRIVERDVRAAGEAATRAVPVSGIRRLVAERMAASARSVAAVTLTTEADATELVALRERVRADGAGTELAVPSYNDMFARILAVALAEHPELNASWSEAGIVRHGAVHVGIAVETERGLLVPVVRDVGSKSLRAVATEAARLIERARTGQAGADELSGGTITITNLGRYEVDAFTPIVNPPEAAILGLGRIVAKAVVVDEAGERIAVRKMVALSLTFDHRIVDGAPAARFLQAIKQLVEHPHRWALG